MYSTVLGDVDISSDTNSNALIIYPVSTRSSLPKPGQTVYLRVTKTTPRFAGADIIGLCLDSDKKMIPLPVRFKATIRQQDIYSVDERDTASVYDCFRPMDIVRGRVIGIGDASTGILVSTGASGELGVVLGKSKWGGELLPVAWNEMMCGKTGLTEKRKVAKPDDPETQVKPCTDDKPQ